MTISPHSATELRIGGLARLSSVDWPGQLAATVFTQGCPWECAYCHNPHLLPANPEARQPELVWPAVRAFLESRVGLLDGVVFSGGEPLAQVALPAAIAEIRRLGFDVALHTSGVHPARFAEVLPQLAWVGFDAKAPRALYDRVTRVDGSAERATASLSALVASGVPFEARTTLHPDLLGEAELVQLAEELRRAGVRSWAVQPYRALGARPGLLSAASVELTDELLTRLAEGFESFEVRG